MIDSLLIGIDLGTTSVKALLLSNSGEVIASSGEEYALDYDRNNKCELDPEVYWDVTCRVIRSLLSKAAGSSSKIKGLAFSSQGETIIVVDSKGRPLRKAIIWLDNRSVREAAEIIDKFGIQTIMDITGQPEVLPIWPATRVLWLRKNEPDTYNKIKKILLVEDYLIFRMTGEYCTEHSLVSSTLYFDIEKKIWWDDMLDFLGITSNQLPAVNPSGTRIGNITSEAAKATGLPKDLMVVTGSYDHPAGAIGAGNISAGMSTLTIGASMALCATIDKKINDLSLRLSCQCHSVQGKYFLLPYSNTSGMVLKWFRDTFYQPEIEKAGIDGRDVYELLTEMASRVPAGADGLVMLPQFTGSGSPDFNQKARGAFVGITPGMHKGHFVRAIIEALSAEVLQNIELLSKNNVPVDQIHFLGGGSKSHLWCQILSDMTGLKVSTKACQENASLGAAILAGTGTGIFESIGQGCLLSVKPERVYDPSPEMNLRYKTVYGNYMQVYKLLSQYWVTAN